ncbi:methyl-accepting chemotaxis protein [Achromobacter sp. UMC46]|uniref:methyl-accepting chemotaxis protein n=1 Tax=Achromobacter sp. UMC46 TaxID=1862319 RepID=UPI001601F75D|nr:methyl-accepting chemotaxis protein [Achromobacter sp. UMC46]MBB1592826.1 hypothetical protein [Achromobacter sp. UMC46]
MLKNLKVRHCLALVLAAFMAAMIAANGASWMGLRSSNEKLTDLNATMSKQVMPAYGAFTLMLRARLMMDRAWAHSQAQREAEAAVAIQRADEFWKAGLASFRKFAEAPKSADVQEKAEPVLREFKQYGELMQAYFKQLRQPENAESAALSRSFQAATTEFDTVMSDFLRYVDLKTDQYVLESEEAYVDAIIVIVVLLAGSALLGIGAAYFVSRAVLRPLTLAGDHFQRIAGGDLTGDITVHSTNELGQLFSALQRMQASLAYTVGEVGRGVREIGSGTQEIADGNLDLSARTEQQAASLEETAASMEQLAATVKQNADNARQANQLAEGASQVANRGGQAVAEVVRTMEEISTSSSRISEIVSVIDGIAFQTNILALNAAVEAARAGGQGKGFAVVAAEVRALAQRSAIAAKEVKELIVESSARVSAGTQQVGLAGETMQEIVAAVSRVTEIMAQIAAASIQQSAGIEQVNRAVVQMDQVTQQNAALVEQAAAAAQSLREQTQGLAATVSVFTVAEAIGAVHVLAAPSRHALQQPFAALTSDARYG